MIKFEKIKPGMVLYDVHSETMGNTTMRSVGVWPVEIVSVDEHNRCAMVRWNHNPPRKWYERQLSRLRAKEPELEKVGFTYRIKRKPETERKP